MQPTLIDRALKYTKELLESDYSGHDFFHTYRVYKMATHIATKEGADIEIVGLAALLHDVDDRKISPETYENLDNARNFLRDNHVDEATISTICLIIKEISYAGKDSVTPQSLEGKCVQDADRLDAIGAIGIARAFAYGGNHNRMLHHPDIKPCENMSKKEYYEHTSTTVNHFYEKLFLLKELMNTNTAKTLAKSREHYMQEFLSRFYAEWDGQL